MITIWHNPRCSKSRQTLALLEEAGQELVVRKYLEDAPSVDELTAARIALDLPSVRAMVRTGEKVFKELDLGKEADDAALIAAMAAHPILIERPIVFKAGKAIIGRPPEQVASLLND